MVVTFNFLDLPAEVREQIYRHYFQVDGGYVHHVESDKLMTADNHPIELSLLYTCRTIAHEARHVPLSLNAIEFKTRYRPESNNLAGCFNLVAFTYQLLQSELTTLLAIAGAMTPEIRDRLALEFPDFSQRLATALPSYEDEHEYYSENPVGDRRISRSRSPLADDPDPSVNHIRQLRSTLCYSTQDALAEKASILYLSSGYYRGFSRLSRPYYHNWYWYWSNSFWEAEGAFSSALKLLAEHNPAEFSRQINTNFPQWAGTYPPDEFLNLRFEHWEIPTPEKVKHAMDLLAIGDLWHLPGIWCDARSCCKNDDDDDMTSINQPHCHHPVAGGIRCREKIRFSAVANAIQFLNTRFSVEQRLDIRSLILNEDLPSVNSPSAHAQGLAPFYRENPQLRVERRVDLMGCVFPALASPTHVADRIRDPGASPDEPEITGGMLRSRITQWLLDALAVTDVGIPAEAFTLVLQAGSYKDYFADRFQRQIQEEIALCRAFKTINPEYPYARLTEPLYGSIQSTMIQEQEVDALGILGNDNLSILRSDFNPGVEREFDTLINETSNHDASEWFHAWSVLLGNIDQPPHQVDYNTRLLENFEVRTD
ncbi:hypothetical protein HYE68_011073 [Fusarium pseudograminearum]|nr:hypothetical protein HYE68_011073 [Fusarium pseudograminearum]